MKRIYRKLRVLLCKKLCWHKPGLIFGNINDPLHQCYGVCRFCGYNGMIDSQGNLF